MPSPSIPELWVERLDLSQHERRDFDCGRPDLNNWLATTAGQAQMRHISAQTFVLTGDGHTVTGYYALSSHAVVTGDVPQRLAKGQLRDFPIPAILIARFAVALDYQGRGLGERLLADAVRRVLDASQSIGIALLVVDALDDMAAQFYERYGFERWPTDSTRLFARVKDIAATFQD